MELEDLLILLQRYGVSSYKDQHLELEFAAPEPDDGDFGIDISQLQVFGDDVESN